MDAGADDAAALRDRAQRRRDELAGGGEDDRRVELLGRRAERVAGPFGAELERELPCRLVARPDEREHPPSLVPGDLDHHVSRRAEAVEAEPLRVAGQPQRSVPDQPGAEERRRLDIGVARRDPEAVAGIRDRELGVAAVELVAGEERPVAEVLAAPSGSTRHSPHVQPSHGTPTRSPGSTSAPRTDRLGPTDDLVARDERQLRLGQLAVDDVEVGPAHAAGSDPEQHLARAGNRVRQPGRAQSAARFVEHHRAHVGTVGAGYIRPLRLGGPPIHPAARIRAPC